MGKFTPSSTATPDLEVDSGTLSVDTDANKVGIGTTSPSDELTVVGAVSGSGIFKLGTSLSSSGDLAATGSVHAAYFYGDGSGLTNVSDVGSASSLSGTTSQVTTGYETSGFLKVSGSSTLGAVTATTISASSNLTAVGNATVVGTLNVTGNADFNGTITCDDSITIDSVTITDTEIGYLDGLTLGTVAASKVVTVDGSKDASGFRDITLRNASGSGKLEAVGNAEFGGDLKVSGSTTIAGQLTSTQALQSTTISASSNLTAVGNAYIIGTLNVTGNADFDGTITCDDSITIDSVTITDTEIGYLDGLTPGTVAASKVVTADSNKDFSGFRNVSGSGVLEVVGNTVLGGDLNVSGTTTLAGVTSAQTVSATVISASSNLTAVGNAFIVGTLNVTGNADFDGTITCDDSITIDSVTITDTEIGYLDGLTLGTVAASKVVTVDSNKDFSGLRNVSSSGETTIVGDTRVGGNLHVTGAYIGASVVTATTFSGSGNLYGVAGLFTSGEVAATGSVNTKAHFSGSGAITVGQNAVVVGSLKVTGTVLPVEGAVPGAGGGIDAVSPTVTVHNMNGEIVTTILIDIGAGDIISSSDANDVIGEDGVANAYLTRITDAINGIIYRGNMSCIEVPTTGDPNINLTANADGTIAEDATGNAEHTLAVAGGDWTKGLTKMVSIPAGGITNDYLYLVHAGTVAGEYDAGKFIIKLYGASF